MDAYEIEILALWLFAAGGILVTSRHKGRDAAILAAIALAMSAIKLPPIKAPTAVETFSAPLLAQEAVKPPVSHVRPLTAHLRALRSKPPHHKRRR